MYRLILTSVVSLLALPSFGDYNGLGVTPNSRFHALWTDNSVGEQEIFYDFKGGEVTGLVFRVERATGDVFAAGAFIPGGADLAERIDVSEPVEPGDVVELDPGKPEHYRKARGNSKFIAGVITTEPGFILGNSPEEMEGHNALSIGNPLLKVGHPMLTLLGRVPVKATTDNGPILPGDLLTVSSKPGYAMLCAKAKSCEGAIIGKALEGLKTGDGVILVLVMSH